ncbi:MAG: lysophospholipid acyltransferase family protein [Pseudomonadota bacterium]|nr:lysophospholipid acyltransferase family protein [Pseudomonadota bacterium]
MAGSPEAVRKSTGSTLKERFLIGLMRAVSRLPLSTSQNIGRLFSYGILKIPNKQRRNALINIRLCLPGLTTEEALSFRARSLRENGKTYFEIARLLLRPADEVLSLVRRVSGGELLQREDGRGVIVLSPHLGAWELAGLYLSSLGPTTTLYKPQPVLDSVILQSRARKGASLVPTNALGIRRLMEALKRGEYVGILPDQEPKGDRGAVFAPFFGFPAFTMLLVSRLARKTGARVVFMFAERLPGGKGFDIHCLPAPAGIDSDDDLEAATALNAGVEQCVRICAEQYIWPYKRFRNRPDGQPKVYLGPL